MLLLVPAFSWRVPLCPCLPASAPVPPFCSFPWPQVRPGRHDSDDGALECGKHADCGGLRYPLGQPPMSSAGGPPSIAMRSAGRTRLLSPNARNTTKPPWPQRD